MFPRSVCVLLGAALLAGLAAAEPPVLYDPATAELGALLEEVKQFQAQVEQMQPGPRFGVQAVSPSFAQVRALRAAVGALRENVDLAGGKVIETPPLPVDPTWAELRALLEDANKLRTQVEALQPPRIGGGPSVERVKELRAAAKTLRDGADVAMGKVVPAPPIPPRPNVIVPETDGDPREPSGVTGRCWSRYVPGVPGAASEPPAPLPKARMRLLSLDGKEVIQETTANDSGEFRLAVQAGKYLLDAPSSSGSKTQLEVTVRPGKWTTAEITVTHLGV